jgi:hypothetical protein
MLFRGSQKGIPAFWVGHQEDNSSKDHEGRSYTTMYYHMGERIQSHTASWVKIEPRTSCAPYHLWGLEVRFYRILRIRRWYRTLALFRRREASSGIQLVDHLMIMRHCKIISPFGSWNFLFVCTSFAACREHVIERIHGPKVKVHVAGTFHSDDPEWILPNALPESRSLLNKDVNVAFYSIIGASAEDHLDHWSHSAPFYSQTRRPLGKHANSAVIKGPLGSWLNPLVTG